MFSGVSLTASLDLHLPKPCTAQCSQVERQGKANTRLFSHVQGQRSVLQSDEKVLVFIYFI